MLCKLLLVGAAVACIAQQNHVDAAACSAGHQDADGCDALAPLQCGKVVVGINVDLSCPQACGICGGKQKPVKALGQPQDTPSVQTEDGTLILKAGRDGKVHAESNSGDVAVDLLDLLPSSAVRNLVQVASDSLASEMNEIKAKLEKEITSAVTTSADAAATARQVGIDQVLSQIASNGAADTLTVKKLDNTKEQIDNDILPSITDITKSVAKLMACSNDGKVLGSDGECKNLFVTCKKTPELISGNKNVQKSSVTFVYHGEPVVGAIAEFGCPTNFYSKTKKAACLTTGLWSGMGTKSPYSVNAMCTPCADFGDEGAAEECIPDIFNSCVHTYKLGLPSGYYDVMGGDGTHHNAYCLNDESLAWKLDKAGPGAGGGWEILHTQIGGHNRQGGQISNFELRRKGYKRTNKITPYRLNDGNGKGDQILAQGSQMSNSWHLRTKVKGSQWMKFMAAHQNRILRKQDRQLMDFDSNVNMAWFFPNNNVNMGGGWGCRSMGGYITMWINGKNVGKTNHATGHTGSLGLANEDNDRCGQNSNNYIRARANRGKHGFTRIDGATQDNSMRHLITYSDRDNGMSASRCGYCCWGCGGWSELVMWGWRPSAP